MSSSDVTSVKVSSQLVETNPITSTDPPDGVVSNSLSQVDTSVMPIQPISSSMDGPNLSSGSIIDPGLSTPVSALAHASAFTHTPSMSPEGPPRHAPPIPSHAFYASPHQAVFHAPHAFQFQPSYPPYSPPYFQPHPMYPVHAHTNWPPPPAPVSHPAYTTPPPSFYAWPPPHVQTPPPPPQLQPQQSPAMSPPPPGAPPSVTPGAVLSQGTLLQLQQPSQPQPVVQHRSPSPHLSPHSHVPSANTMQSFHHITYHQHDTESAPRHRRRPSLSGPSHSPHPHRLHARQSHSTDPFATANSERDITTPHVSHVTSTPTSTCSTVASTGTTVTTSGAAPSITPMPVNHVSRRLPRRRGNSVSDDREVDDAGVGSGRDRGRDRSGIKITEIDGKHHFQSHLDPLVASSSNISTTSTTSTSSDRRHIGSAIHVHHSLKPNGRPPQATESSNGFGSQERDLHTQIADLDKSAHKAVASADDVTLALLLTSWANSLAEARHHGQTPATQFEAVFHGSHALDTVANNVLVTHPSPDSPVRKALIALFGFVLYGDHRLHARLSELIVDVNSALPAMDAPAREACVRSRDIAVSHTLNFLKDVAANMRAYADILPPSPDVREKMPSRLTRPTHTPDADTTGPAGPDPSKAVERSMDTWRRAVARLQGEMALVVVLNKAFTAADVELRLESSDFFTALDSFFAAVRQAVRKHIESDLAARIDRLNAVYWANVAQGAETTVFQATRQRASQWITQFEAARHEIERQLDDAGIGFGPAAPVSADKSDVLLGASASVAALISCQQRGFTWAMKTSRLLTAMVDAVRSLEGVADGRLAPSGELRKKFFASLDNVYSAIDNVVNWSFAALHDKVLGSLEKSCGKGGDSVSVEPAPRIRALRFEEPPKTPAADGGDTADGGSSVSRRKSRHVRIKSSPDALLHLNARHDFSDEDSDVDHTVDRELEFNDEEDSYPATATDGSGEKSDVAEDESDSDVHEHDPQVNSTKDYDGQSAVKYMEEDDDEEDDRDIIVHDDVGDDAKPKKVNHASHIRSVSVDGIPF